jgi:uncharacterized protein YgbK (DUF1537 family)
LELFKKTLPGSSASLLQVKITAKSMAKSALAALKHARTGSDPRVDFIELAMKGGKVGFEKIIKLIDELVATLKK